jgi:hypothetical protein
MAHRETDGTEPYFPTFSLVVGIFRLNFLGFDSADRSTGF